jgi:hypothetical protein
MDVHFTLEGSLPGAQARSSSLKNISISFCPNAICRDHEDFHEKGVRRSIPCYDYFLK